MTNMEKICVVAMMSLGFLLVLSQATSNECYSRSNEKQCSYGQVCRDNMCQIAPPCDSNANCDQFGFKCVADYCQKEHCNKTGECVFGQICSHFGGGVCVYPVELKVKENEELTLRFPDPKPENKQYTEIGWLKQSGDSPTKIVLFQQDFTDKKALYFNEYCQIGETCNDSKKARLNVETGDLTIFHVKLEDEAKYHYWFVVDEEIPDTGVKYAIDLEVYVNPNAEDIQLDGLPGVIGIGSEVKLTSTIERIKPPAKSIYWNVTFGRRRSGRTSTELNKDGKTFRQTSNIDYRFTRQDQGKRIQYTMIPLYGEAVKIRKRVNLRRNLDEDEGTKEKEPNDKCVNKTPRDDGVMPKEENQSNVGLIIGILLCGIVIGILATLIILKIDSVGRRLKGDGGGDLNRPTKNHKSSTLET